MRSLFPPSPYWFVRPICKTKATVISFNSWPHIKHFQPFRLTYCRQPQLRSFGVFFSFLSTSYSFLWLHLGAENLVLWKVFLCWTFYVCGAVVHVKDGKSIFREIVVKKTKSMKHLWDFLHHLSIETWLF